MRLVDLHCDWLRQYATETTLYDGSLYPEVPERVGRLDGYLLGTSLAVLVCARKPGDWSRQPDAWHSLALMIARYEAEFTGRILHDVADVARWRSSIRDGLCWGVIGVAGFDFLVRKVEHLDRLPALFGRGVRVFQPVATGEGLLGGGPDPGDDRGLSELGQAFIARVAGLARTGEPGPRPILDLAGMNARSVDEVLRQLGDEPGSGGEVLVMLSRSTGGDRDLLDGSSPDSRNLAVLRSRGGVIALAPGRPGCETVESLKDLVARIAAMPFEDRPGNEGIAIGSDLLGLDQSAPGLASARDLTRSLGRTFDRETAAAIAYCNAERLLLRSAGIAMPGAERLG